MPTNDIKAKVENAGQVDPAEAAKIEKSLKGKEQAPTTLEQTGGVDWKTVRDALGQPFDVDRIPLRKLRQMRRDPMIAFGLHYRQTPLVRAQWHMDARDKDGPNAQVAGFMDSAWRAVHARYMFQHTRDFSFGLSPIAKRFAIGNPGGVYFDPEDTNPDTAMKPVWDEGTIEPVIWKPFVALPPEQCQPIWTKDGEFDGITYEVVGGQAGGRKSTGRSKKGNDRERIIDVYHALWATNDKDSVDGSIFGYPLIAHGYRFWWSYWFLWANLDRAFERMAVPPMVAYHPEGDYEDPEDPSQNRPYWEIALEAANSLRSNAIAAVPSTMATAGLEEDATNQREWEFKFLETPHQNFEEIAAHLSYLDMMKLRALMIPENALITGEGGSGQRNIATQMAEIFNESQANKWEEVADHINRFILPQLLAVNFPEFVNNGGTCRIVGHGFAKEDTEFLKQIIQLVGQGDPAALGVDIREALTRVGTPLKSPAVLAREKQELIAQGAAGGPPAVTTPNGVNVVPAPGIAPGSTNGGSVPEPNAPGASVTGFSDEPYMVYVNPRAHIELSEHDDFLAALPDTSHYKDKTMRALAVQLRKQWLGALREFYPSFAKWLKDQPLTLSAEEVMSVDAELNLADAGDPMEFAETRNRRKAERLAKRLLAEWSISDKRIKQVEKASRQIIERMYRRSAVLAGKQLKHTPQLDDADLQDRLDYQVGRLIKSVTGTTKANMQSLLVNDIMEGKTPEEIAQNITEHFDEFPDWRASRIARSETRDAFNHATLTIAKEAGLRYVRAKDAQLGPTDEDCEARDGKLLTIREAKKELDKTHANDTLEFEPIARAEFSIKNVEQLPDAAPDEAAAWFDEKTCTAYLPVNLSDDDTDEFLGAVVEYIAA